MDPSLSLSLSFMSSSYHSFLILSLSIPSFSSYSQKTNFKGFSPNHHHQLLSPSLFHCFAISYSMACPFYQLFLQSGQLLFSSHLLTEAFKTDSPKEIFFFTEFPLVLMSTHSLLTNFSPYFPLSYSFVFLSSSLSHYHLFSRFSLSHLFHCYRFRSLISLCIYLFNCLSSLSLCFYTFSLFTPITLCLALIVLSLIDHYFSLFLCLLMFF